MKKIDYDFNVSRNNTTTNKNSNGWVKYVIISTLILVTILFIVFIVLIYTI